jgi:hypothetical protein
LPNKGKNIVEPLEEKIVMSKEQDNLTTWNRPMDNELVSSTQLSQKIGTRKVHITQNFVVNTRKC